MWTRRRRAIVVGRWRPRLRRGVGMISLHHLSIFSWRNNDFPSRRFYSGTFRRWHELRGQLRVVLRRRDAVVIVAPFVDIFRGHEVARRREGALDKGPCTNRAALGRRSRRRIELLRVVRPLFTFIFLCMRCRSAIHARGIVSVFLHTE
jgi:hypothetical protein